MAGYTYPSFHKQSQDNLLNKIYNPLKKKRKEEEEELLEKISRYCAAQRGKRLLSHVLLDSF